MSLGGLAGQEHHNPTFCWTGQGAAGSRVPSVCRRGLWVGGWGGHPHAAAGREPTTPRGRVRGVRGARMVRCCEPRHGVTASRRATALPSP